MSLLASLQSQTDIADETDYIGGNSTKESGLYDATVTMAYLQKSKGGALGLVLTLATKQGDVRQTLWMASGDAKGNKNYYEKDGERFYLPGYNMANSLCLLTVGKEIGAMDTETKLVNVYNSELKKEVPTSVEVLVELLGKEILVGLIKQTVDKTVNDGSGNYVPTGESRDENEIDKLFRSTDRKTTAEIRDQSSEAVFVETWNTKWAGVTKDRTTKGVGAVAGAPRTAANSATNKKPTASLFG